jgi:hypothetical protein
MIGLSAGLVGCGGFLGLGGSEFDRFVEDADRICVESFNRGIEGEEFEEELWKERGWTDARIEAEIRYAWADALVGQYENIAALGPAPEKPALMRRWNRTALERARLYRRVGDAWLESNERQKLGFGIFLRLAKLRADHLAEPISFRACGQKIGQEKSFWRERLETGQLLGYAPRIFVTEFPLSSASTLRRVVSVYRHGHVVGRVVRQVPGSETVLVEFRLNPRSTDAVSGARLRLIRSHGAGAPRLVLFRFE